MKTSTFILCVALFASSAGMQGMADTPSPAGELLPTGQRITPLAAPGARFQPLKAGIGPKPDYVADGAAASAVSPDGRTLLVLTSGYNRFNNPDGSRNAEQSQQYVFVYDLAHGAKPLQTLPVANAFYGLAWAPDGGGFYVSGGVDDWVAMFTKTGQGFAQAGTIALGHKAGLGVKVKPQAGGLAVSPDGTRLLVANYYNDSISLIDLAAKRVAAELDLRPGAADPAQHGVAGGEFPLAVAWRDDGHAYVSAPRDRQIVALDVKADAVSVAGRIAVQGEPTNLLLDTKRRRLYAVEDNDDALLVIDAGHDALIGEVRLGLPEALGGASFGHGVNPNALAFLPGAGRLLVTYGGINALAVVALADARSSVTGLIPTAWYPSAVAASADGRQIFIANRKSPPGPNPLGCGPRTAVVRAQPNACGGANQYVFQLEKAGLLTLPAPTPAVLARMTRQVGANIGLGTAQSPGADDALIAALRARIKHVVFIVKENRTYDQVLGDLEIGNGDPKLAILGEALSPNHHDLARQFVTFDNFLDSGEQSSTGWNWSTAARTTDLMERTAAVNYAGRGLDYEAEGTNRGVNVSLSTAERRTVNPNTPDDPDLLPGPANVTSPDGDIDDAKGEGFLWDAAIRAGLSVRNYGFANDFIYEEPNSSPSLQHDPAKAGEVVYHATYAALAARSDPYYRGFDQRYPDFWRIQEWMRDFDAQLASNRAPALTLLRVSHDHFGDFAHAIDGVNTVETEMADNDYALGLIVEHIAQSPISDSTLIFVIEDDAQNGADHVDARRSLAYIVGPYVRQHALVSTRYTTVSMLHTIGAILGLRPLGLNDALAPVMTDAFDLKQRDWRYHPRVPAVLRMTALPLPPAEASERAAPASLSCTPRSPQYWTTAMSGQDFSSEDRLDTNAFNAALWRGLGPRQNATGAADALPPCAIVQPAKAGSAGLGRARQGGR